MQSFTDKIAVITGGGSGMGRELAVKLAAAGAHVAMCDVSEENLAETAALCSDHVTITTHLCDVSNEEQMLGFRDEVLEQHQTDSINLLFNNAGIGGGGSFVADSRERWERTFDICWQGVYLGCRAFVPLVIASDEGHVVNTASINGFWASIGPTRPHTAYAAAKFAVKGFTEALITDFRVNAPHVQASVVMPGHIGTGIALNSALVQGSNVTSEVNEWANAFRNNAPTTSAEAADVILNGVLTNQWRILVGEDAEIIDAAVRDDPEGAYENDFVHRLHAAGALEGLVVAE